MDSPRVAALALASGLAVGCAQPFYRADPPVQSRGVSVGLVNQQCDRRIDPNWSVADILGLEVRLRVLNASASDVAFDPRKVRLLADGEARAPRSADSGKTVPAGTAAVFGVDFLERDENLACNVPMALSVDGAVAVGPKVLPFPPLRFLVSTEDI